MNLIKHYIIEDCQIDFHNLFEFGYSEINDKITRNSILKYCNDIDNTWLYACDERNNLPSVIEGSDCILEMYKKNPNSMTFTYFKFSFKEYAIEIGLMPKIEKTNESN